ncbi:MAG TPA: hypothetical protein PKG57_10660, partial [Flavobacteriales bacterium]|nr:hypothetical protein [Flavobacteriales bacterium]
WSPVLVQRLPVVHDIVRIREGEYLRSNKSRMGRTVLSWPKPVARMDAGQLPAGTYLFIVLGRNGLRLATQRFIKR